MKFVTRSPLLLAIGLIFCCGLIGQDTRGPSTAEERSKAVQAARLLESDPFHKDAKEIREWFLVLLIQVPDISVQICSDYLPALYGKKRGRFDSELAMQMTYSSAAFIIEHPELANDKVAVNLAGLEGTLRMYEAILEAKPKATNKLLEELISRRENDQLRAYVEDVAANKCKSGNN